MRRWLTASIAVFFGVIIGALVVDSLRAGRLENLLPGLEGFWLAIIGVIIAFLLMLAVLSGIGKFRRTTVIAADSKSLQMFEISLISPLNVAWNLAAVRSIRAVPTADGRRASLEIVPNTGVALVLLARERRADVEWVSKVLNDLKATGSSPAPQISA